MTSVTATSLNISTSNVTVAPVVPPVFLQIVGQDIAWLILTIFTVITNGLFLLIIASVKNLRKASNSFIASMSLVGILWALMYLLPRFVLRSILAQNAFYCSFTALLGIFFSIVINLHLCLISLDKYVAIIFPFFYIKHANTCSHASAIVAVWMIPLLVAIIPPISFRKFIQGVCVTLNFNEIASELNYFIFVFSLLFFIPIVCMVLAYGHIFWVANKHLKVLMDRDGGSQRVFLNIKAAKYLSLIVSVFLITWLPYILFFFIIFVNRISDVNLELLFALRYLAFCYPCINPIIYGFFQSDLRRQITKNVFYRSNRVEVLSASQFGMSIGRSK